MAPRGQSSALLVVRTGATLLYFHDRELAREYLSNMKPSVSLSAETPKMSSSELIDFESNFTEMVCALLPGTPHSASAALRALKPFFPPQLTNDVRGLLRARGHAAHPVPAGKVPRILAAVQSALTKHLESDTEPPRDDESITEAISTTSLASSAPAARSLPSPPSVFDIGEETCDAMTQTCHTVENTKIIDSAENTYSGEAGAVDENTISSSEPRSEDVGDCDDGRCTGVNVFSGERCGSTDLKGSISWCPACFAVRQRQLVSGRATAAATAVLENG